MKSTILFLTYEPPSPPSPSSLLTPFSRILLILFILLQTPEQSGGRRLRGAQEGSYHARTRDYCKPPWVLHQQNCCKDRSHPGTLKRGDKRRLYILTDIIARQSGVWKSEGWWANSGYPWVLDPSQSACSAAYYRYCQLPPFKVISRPPASPSAPFSPSPSTSLSSFYNVNFNL